MTFLEAEVEIQSDLQCKLVINGFSDVFRRTVFVKGMS